MLQKGLSKGVVFVVGGAVLIWGIVLIPTPAPEGIVLIPLGLIILAGEFSWAGRMLSFLKRKTGPIGQKIDQAHNKAWEIYQNRFTRLSGGESREHE